MTYYTRLPSGGLFFMLIINSRVSMVSDMEKKMLREIANDNQTPKKRDLPLQNDLYERLNPTTTNLNDGLYDDDWDTSEPIPLAEF